MLILVNGHPIGTIEGKQPAKDAMEHPNILGEDSHERAGMDRIPEPVPFVTPVKRKQNLRREEIFLWEDLGRGADGRAFLVSGGTKGAVGVLKFFFQDPEQKAMHEERMWKEVYSHLSPVAKIVRIVRFMGQTALLMPWFQCPERTKSTLDAVEKTLREDFMKKGIRHSDVAWRNVGVYYEDG
eukprot:scaffold362_cov176-Amphora_coffeaeformis.AAC.20